MMVAMNATIPDDSGVAGRIDSDSELRAVIAFMASRQMAVPITVRGTVSQPDRAPGAGRRS